MKKISQRLNDLNDKLSKINIENIEDINHQNNSKKNNKYCLFVKNMNDVFDKLDDTIDDFLLNDKTDKEIDDEIKLHIENVKHTRKIINLFTPHILRYQLFNDLNKLS